MISDQSPKGLKGMKRLFLSTTADLPLLLQEGEIILRRASHVEARLLLIAFHREGNHIISAVQDKGTAEIMTIVLDHKVQHGCLSHVPLKKGDMALIFPLKYEGEEPPLEFLQRWDFQWWLAEVR